MLKNVVGLQLKKQREMKGITLTTLAKELNLSVSFLSQIEAGKASPSLSTLKKISDILQTSIGCLVGEIEPKDENDIVRKKDEKLFKEVGKGRKIFFLTSLNDYKLMEPAMVLLKKNADSGDDVAQHFGQEFIYILKGAIELKIKDKKYTLKKGDSIYFNSNLPHFFKNIYDGVTEGLWIASPPAFHK